MKTIGTMIAALALASAAQAQEAANVPTGAPATTPPPPATQSGWRVTTTPSALDPSRSQGVAMLDSTNMVPNSIGRPEAATIVVRCIGSQRVAYFSWPNYLGSRDVRVTYKYDDNPVETALMPVSDSGTAVGRWSTRESANMINSLQSFSRQVVAIAPYQGIAQEVTFDLTGASEAIAEAFAACGG